MSEGLLLEAKGVERTIARIRWGAAALDILLGPFFPNLWLPGVFLLGVVIMAYGVAILRASERESGLGERRHLRDDREGLITNLQPRVARDAAIEQVMRIVAATPPADAIVPAVLRASRDVLRFDRATVFIADDELGEYRPLYRLAGDATIADVPPPRLRLGEGLLGAAMTGGATLLVRNPLADPRYLRGRADEPARSGVPGPP